MILSAKLDSINQQHIGLLVLCACYTLVDPLWSHVIVPLMENYNPVYKDSDSKETQQLLEAVMKEVMTLD